MGHCNCPPTACQWATSCNGDVAVRGKQKSWTTFINREGGTCARTAVNESLLDTPARTWISATSGEAYTLVESRFHVAECGASSPAGRWVASWMSLVLRAPKHPPFLAIISTTLILVHHNATQAVVQDMSCSSAASPASCSVIATKMHTPKCYP